MKKDINNIWAIVTLVFWSLMILFYLPYPLSSWQMIGWLFYAGVLTILAGIMSGILLLLHPRAGRIFAVTLSTILLVVRLWQVISAYPHITERLYANYVVFLKVKPVQVIYNDILGIFFFISTIYIFTKRNKLVD